MLKINDRIKVTVDNSYISGYVKNEFRNEISFIGTYVGIDENYPNSISLVPDELKTDKNFFPQIRIISKRLIKDIILLGEESSRLDLEDLNNEKTKIRTFEVLSSDKSKKYKVTYNPVSKRSSCNCYAGMMNRECRHIKGVLSKIKKEES